MSDNENIPEKEKVNIYDNDEAYMLYDDKAEEDLEDDRLLEDDMDLNLNSDNDNALYDFEGENEQMNGDNQLDNEEDGTRRKTEIEQFNDEDGNENFDNMETLKKNQGKL